jgi:hypothetical protein
VASAGDRIRTRHSRDQLASRRTARLVGLAGFLVAASLPLILWHRAIGAVTSHFRVEAQYLTGWVAYAMIVLGLVFLVPVLLSIGRNPESRLYPRSRNALLGWGVSCYVLGIALATQVAQLASVSGSH